MEQKTGALKFGNPIWSKYSPLNPQESNYNTNNEDNTERDKLVLMIFQMANCAGLLNVIPSSLHNITKLDILPLMLKGILDPVSVQVLLPLSMKQKLLAHN